MSFLTTIRPITMFIRQLALLNFKNIRQAEISFSPKINCLIGPNGSGKTNILDAVYFLSYCKSHNVNIDSQCITHDEDFFVLQGTYHIEPDGEDHIYCGLKRNRKKQFKRNQKEYSRLSDHIGRLPLVFVSPNDQALIAGGSEDRRRFIDSIISQYDHEYLQFLIRYNTALQQRNALLKQNELPSAELFEIWEQQMHDLGSEIFCRRRDFMVQFIPLFQEYYRFLSNEHETVSLAYQSQLTDISLVNLLKEKRLRDHYLGFTTSGIHRDDLEMSIGSYPIRRVGSQGQNKTFLIALKLAQFSFLKKAAQSTPLLLFDDIFDKLDAERVRQIIQLVSEDNFGQIFITDTNREHIDDILSHMQQDSLIFHVENGEVKTP